MEQQEEGAAGGRSSGKSDLSTGPTGPVEGAIEKSSLLTRKILFFPPGKKHGVVDHTAAKLLPPRVWIGLAGGGGPHSCKAAATLRIGLDWIGRGWRTSQLQSCCHPADRIGLDLPRGGGPHSCKAAPTLRIELDWRGWRTSQLQSCCHPVDPIGLNLPRGGGPHSCKAAATRWIRLDWICRGVADHTAAKLLPPFGLNWIGRGWRDHTAAKLLPPRV